MPCLSGGAIGHRLVRLERQKSTPMHDHHRATYKTAKKPERIKKAEEIAFVAHAQGVVETERNALQSIADGNRTLDFPDFTAGAWEKRKPIFAFDDHY